MAFIPGDSATVGYLGVVNGCTKTAYTDVQTLVTNASSETKTVTTLVFFNLHTVAVTVNVYYLPNNSNAVRDPANENDYKFLSVSIPAGETEVFDVPMQLNGQNDTIRFYASVSGKINAFAFGYQE